MSHPKRVAIVYWRLFRNGRSPSPLPRQRKGPAGGHAGYPAPHPRNFLLGWGDKASFHICDVADYDSPANAFQEVWDKYRRMDALCANAGIVDKSSIYIFDHRGKDELPAEAKPRLHGRGLQGGDLRHAELAIHFMRKNSAPGGGEGGGGEFHEGYGEGVEAEHIRFNCVLPGIVATKIIPPEMVAAVSFECMTPISTIVSAYHKCTDDGSALCGEAIECSADKHFMVPRPEYLNGRVSRRATTVWDPLFKMYHGEGSGLPDAIP
ncbi:hypothetical protein MKZ38_006930 [Zalerion maritima]|uniref:Uncharacterized protein n=1 Tax=Zalerion maritima TaxID=339359 RepID=A0AAD5RWY1_9PEZI|nr:hypothetical protein MKZ38_006930 [Zalerion maritima]